MRLPLAALFSLTALLCLSSQARADGYIGAGMGSKSGLHGDIASHFQTDEETSSSRIIIGERFGALAVEASLFGSQLRGVSQMAGPELDYNTVSLGVDLKYHIGLIGALEAYGKIGLNRTWLSAPDANSDWGYQGRGQELGAGLQYSFDLPLAEVGLWLDYTKQDTELRDGERQALDGEISMLNLGVSLGF